MSKRLLPLLLALVLAAGCGAHRSSGPARPDIDLIRQGIATYNSLRPTTRAADWRHFMGGPRHVHDCSVALTADRDGIRVETHSGAADDVLVNALVAHGALKEGNSLGGLPTAGRSHHCELVRSTYGAGRRTITLELR